MRAKILHESKGRMRIQMDCKYMSITQADYMEQWFQKQVGVVNASVHERTRCIVIVYHSKRENIIEYVRRFTWESMDQEGFLSESSRELRRNFEEKLVTKLAMRVVMKTFVPYPLHVFRAIFKSIPYMWRAMRCIRKRRMKVELLDGVSIGVSIFRKDFATAGSVMFLLEIAELLEEWTRRKTMADLANSMALHVDKVWFKTEEGEVLIPISQVTTGDQVVIRSGSVVPLDGVVVSGDVTINQSSLTGENVPVHKRVGGMVYAGTVVEEGECVCEVKAQSGDSRYDKIAKMIEASEQLKSTSESKAALLADRLVPYTFAGSVLSLLLTRSITKALSVLMVDFSCALKIAMPLAVLSAMRDASEKQIVVKGGKFLEDVAKADTMVFDKTGTLTYACPTVAKVIPFSGHDENEMLRMAACLEEHFPHSIATAVVEAAKERGLTHEEFHSKVEYRVAHGIVSMVNDKKVMIGSAHFIFEDENCKIPENDQLLFDTLPEEFSHLYLAIDGQLAAVICISDPIRGEAKKVMNRLRELGISDIVMLTGDNYRTAKSIAAQIGVDDFYAEVLPADKAAYVKQVKGNGRKVIMVGDGINDSPALAEANVGIAVDDGAAIAREVSDITIAAESLYELVYLRSISTALMERIKWNYRFVIGFNSSLILFGLLGILQPSTLAWLHNISTVGISVKSISSLDVKEEEQN